MSLEHRLSALLQLHLHSRLKIWLPGIRQRQPQVSTRIFYVFGFGAFYIRDLTVPVNVLNPSRSPFPKIHEHAWLTLTCSISHFRYSNLVQERLIDQDLLDCKHISKFTKVQTQIRFWIQKKAFYITSTSELQGVWCSYFIFKKIECSTGTSLYYLV